MSRRGQLWLAGGLAVLFAAAGAAFHEWQAGNSRSGQAATGEMVLAGKLLGLDGKPHALAQWRGKVLIVNFWATWCEPCREEIPEFIRIQAQYGARGVQFIGIAIDTAERVAPYAEDIGINYPVLVGGLETMDYARQAGNRAGVLPFTLVMDRGGSVIAAVTGVLRRDKLEGLIKPLL